MSRSGKDSKEQPATRGDCRIHLRFDEQGDREATADKRSTASNRSRTDQMITQATRPDGAAAMAARSSMDTYGVDAFP